MLSEEERDSAEPMVLFGSSETLEDRFADELGLLRETVDETDDDAVLGTDPDRWARRLGRELRIDPPVVDVAAAKLEFVRRSAQDAGSRLDQVPAAPAHRLRISIPVTGEIALLRSPSSIDASPLPGDLGPDHVVREWLWPAERGAEAFDHELRSYLAEVADRAGRIAAQVEAFNSALVSRARAAIEDRRTAILAAREFAGSLSTPVSGVAEPRSARERLIAGVAGWQAPPRNLLLSALVLLILPWDDVLINVLYAAHGVPVLAIFAIWILFDASLIWVVLASGRMVRAAFAYAGIAVALDLALASVYYWLTQFSPAYMVVTGVLEVGYLALITIVMWVRLKGPVHALSWRGKWLALGRPHDPVRALRQRSLFRFVVPLIVSIAAAYATDYAASLTCTAGRACGPYGPPIHPEFFQTAADIIAFLLIALTVEGRLLAGRRTQEERFLVAVTVLGLAIGIGASLTATGGGSKTHVLSFQLTVQALALGLTTLVMLPFLGDLASKETPDPASRQRQQVGVVDRDR